MSLALDTLDSLHFSTAVQQLLFSPDPRKRKSAERSKFKRTYGILSVSTPCEVSEGGIPQGLDYTLPVNVLVEGGRLGKVEGTVHLEEYG